MRNVSAVTAQRSHSFGPNILTLIRFPSDPSNAVGEAHLKIHAFYVTLLYSVIQIGIFVLVDVSGTTI